MALAETLAELVPEAKDIRILVMESDIPLEYVTLTGSPLSNWRNVLEAAETAGKWPKLVTRVLWRFPDHTVLWRALGERAGISLPAQGTDGDVDESEDEMPPESPARGGDYVSYRELAELERRVMAKIEAVNEERRTDAADRDHKLREALQHIVTSQTGMSARTLWAVVILALAAMIGLTGYMFYAASLSRFVPPLSAVWEGIVALWQP